MEDGARKPNLFNIRSKLEDEEKKKLERLYGVRIIRDAMNLSCNIARRHFDDEGKSVESREALLHSKAADLLEKACVSLSSQLDTGEVDEEEISLDADEYMVVRSWVERVETWREKDPDCKIWPRHLDQELSDLMDKWVLFSDKWKPLLKKKHKRSCKTLYREIELLQGLRQGLASCLPNNDALNCSIHTDTWSEMIRQLDVLVTLDYAGFHKMFQQFVTVGPNLIAKVASSLTGVPASWLLRSSPTPPLDNLVTRLSRRQFGKRYPILTIFHALSRAASPGPLRCATRPLGSFLFICGPRHGGPELAEALVEELFDGQGSLICFDLSEYTSEDSVSRLLGVPTSHGESGSLGELAEAVERNPFSVVLLSNIDVAHVSVVNMLTEVSRRGKLTNGQGGTTDFTKTLIIMTSAIGIDKEVSFECDCVRMVEECPIKELLNRHPPEDKHKCSLLARLEKVQKQLKQELFEQLDDIVVFSCLSTQYCKAIARLQLRDIASSMTTRGLIIYPSEAAVKETLWKALWFTGSETLVKVWLEQNLVPVLNDMCAKGEIKDNYIIYVDTLVGTRELSYRLVKRDDFVEDYPLKRVKKSSAELRVLCRKEKARINRIYLLKRKLYALSPTASVDTGVGCVGREIPELFDIINLIISQIDLDLVACKEKVVADKEKVVQRDMIEEMELGLGDGATERAKKGVASLKARLHNRLLGHATDVVARAALRVIDESLHLPGLPVAAFLFLGLTASGKGKLIKELAKDFVADDGAKLLLEINLSAYGDSNSLSRLTDALSGYTVSEDCMGEPFREDVRLRPCSVLFLDQVEKAHMSLITALLSVLDRGMFIDHQGRNVSFRDTIVIITSDAGNKEFFARLAGHASQNIAYGDIKQKAKGFRRSPKALPTIFFDLFEQDDDPDDNLEGDDDDDLEGDDVGELPSEGIFNSCLSKGLIVHDGSSLTAMQ